jgi:hypothetical protein
MSKLLPAIAGVVVIGAASMMKRTKSAAKKAVTKGKTAATAARSKITKKRASHAPTKRKPARKR